MVPKPASTSLVGLPGRTVTARFAGVMHEAAPIVAGPLRARLAGAPACTVTERFAVVKPVAAAASETVCAVGSLKKKPCELLPEVMSTELTAIVQPASL